MVTRLLLFTAFVILKPFRPLELPFWLAEQPVNSLRKFRPGFVIYLMYQIIMNSEKARYTLLIAGTFLFFIGLLNGFVIPFFAVPKNGLSAHLAAVQGGMALIIFALTVQYINLKNSQLAFVAWSNIYSMHAAWLAFTLAASWGADKSIQQKTIIKLLAYTGGFATTAGVAFILIGLINYRRLSLKNPNE